MKLLFRRKADGYIMKPIQTMPTCVRLRHAASDSVFRASKVALPQLFEVLSHDIERGDVLRDIRDGSMWIVEYVGLHGLRMQSRKDGVAGMTYFGLVNYERVGRKYSLRDRQPHERVEFRESQPAYATYNTSKVQEPIRHATREIVEVSQCCGAEVVRDPGGQAFCCECAGVL